MLKMVQDVILVTALVAVLILICRDTQKILHKHISWEAEEDERESDNSDFRGSINSLRLAEQDFKYAAPEYVEIAIHQEDVRRAQIAYEIRKAKKNLEVG